MSSQRNLWFQWFKHRRRFSEILVHFGRVTASNGGLGSPQKVLILGWDSAFIPEEFCIYDRDVCIKGMRAVRKLEHMYMLLFHLLILFERIFFLVCRCFLQKDPQDHTCDVHASMMTVHLKTQTSTASLWMGLAATASAPFKAAFLINEPLAKNSCYMRSRARLKGNFEMFALFFILKWFLQIK